jgi:ubiquinone/menaquinone biosynthesis C-methylase UbiE
MQDFFSQKQWIFDRWAPSYDCLFPSVFYRATHQRLLDYVDLPAQPSILDLGCGTGRLLNRLASHYPSLKGTGLDLSPQMIRQARQGNLHHSQLIFLQGNAEALPFAEGQFNAVFNSFSFLHYPNPERVLAEVSRVLSPSGRFYLVDLAVRWTTSAQTFAVGAGSIRLYPQISRQRLGQAVGLSCRGDYDLLGPVLLSVFEKD